MQLTPHARPDDGLFALTYALKIPKWEVMLQTGRFYRGTILEHPKVRGFQTASIRVEPRGAAPVLLEADGEFLGQAPAVFSLLPRALRVG
jgi:diacylglycerol kinase family enzyme